MSARSTDWRAAANPRRSAWVSANAGTGKTYTLANRVTRLLLDEADPAKILCLTYTKTAAAEMQRRLFEQLGKWAMLDDEALKKNIIDIGAAPPNGNELREARRLFAQALETPGGLKIQTIHAFCERLLSRFPLEAGVPPAFRVLDEQTARELIAEAQTRILEDAGSGGALEDAVAVLATNAGEQSVLELLKTTMGADRGKLEAFVAGKDSKTIAQEIAQSHGVSPQETYESAAENFCAGLKHEEARLREAIAWLSGGGKNDKKLAGRLSFIIEANFGGHCFDDFALSLLTQENGIRKELVSKRLREACGHLGDYIIALADRIRAAKQHCLAARAAVLTRAAVTLADAGLHLYAEEKRLRGVLDYNDLIVETMRLLERGTTASWVLYKLDEGLDHILIDEAQDTSAEQWRIVKKLTEEFFAGIGARDGKPRTVFVVGDEKQSIFSFQGAHPTAFGENRKFFAEFVSCQGTALEEVDLAISRRSTREILDFVDAVIANPRARDGLTSDGHIVRHEPFREKDKGRVEFWALTPRPERDEPDYWMLPLDVEAPNSAVRRLANEIALRIKQWTDGKTVLTGHEKPIMPGDIMILTPQREPFASEVIKRLRELNVPVAGADRIKLIEQIGVVDLIALGRFALLPEDDLNLAALLRSPLIGLSDGDLFDLANPRKGGLWSELSARRGECAVFGAAQDYLARVFARADFAPPHEFYAQALSADGGRLKLLSRLGMDSADAIDEFLSLALAYEALNTPSLEGFLHWIERGETEIKRDMERERNEVRVMTVHGAKGLEADIVILPDTTRPPTRPGQRPQLLFTEEGVFYPVSDSEAPACTNAAKQAAHEAALREYRRLLYVALTRAKDRLYICGFAGRNKPSDNSWYSLIQEAVGSLGIESEQCGQKLRVFGEADIEPAAAAQEAIAAHKPLPGWALKAPPAERKPRLIRPFDATGLDDIVSSPLSDGNATRFRRGLLIHALLAGLPNVAAAQRAAVAKKFLSGHDVPPEEAAVLSKKTLALLDDPVFTPAFAPGSRAEVAIVAKLDELNGDTISGRIDRLAVSDGEVLIVDFKTNRPPPEREEDVPDLYLTQMALYRAALAKLYPGKRIVAALVWTERPSLMRLPEARLDEEIGRIRARLDSVAPRS